MKVAEWREKSGAMHLHVVDLDGAFAGESRNREAVEAIVEEFVSRHREAKGRASFDSRWHGG